MLIGIIPRGDCDLFFSCLGEAFLQTPDERRRMLFDAGAGGGMSSTRSGSGGCELISMGSFKNPGGGRLILSGVDEAETGSGTVIAFSSGGAQVDSDPGLNHDSAEWSIDEQFKLEEGLARCASEPNILHYIKIAASLRNKTVRDVALRCRWMTRKRRKQEEQRLRKKEKDLKEKLELSMKNGMPSSASSVKVAPHSLTVNHHDQSNCMLSGVFNGKARHLLEENRQTLGQISVNLLSLELQQNMDLFFRTRNNLTAILNDMRNMPGVMSQMPPLPVLLDVELANSILPHPPQFTYITQPMKQERGS